MWHPHSGSTQMWFQYKPVGAHRPIPGPFALLHTSRFPSPWIVSPLGGHISFLISASTQKQVEVGAACLALVCPNAFFSFSSPSPPPAFSIADPHGTTFLRHPTLPTLSH